MLLRKVQELSLVKIKAKFYRKQFGFYKLSFQLSSLIIGLFSTFQL